MSHGVLVTGGAGFIGSHLVDFLIRSGAPVTILDNFSTGSHENVAYAARCGQLRIVTGSILDPRAIAEAMEGCRCVVHPAVQCVRRSLGLPLESHDVNPTGTLNVLEEARKRRIERFVYCSSSEVYGNSSSQLLDEDSTVCRPVTVYGA